MSCGVSAHVFALPCLSHYLQGCVVLSNHLKLLCIGGHLQVQNDVFCCCRGWNINVNFLTDYQAESDDSGESFNELGVSDKFMVVMHVATKVQVLRTNVCRFDDIQHCTNCLASAS